MSELVPVQLTKTLAEVVCVRREGAYIRLPDWCSRTLVRLDPEDYPKKVTPYGQIVRPAAGVTYVVRAQLPTASPPQLLSFHLDFLDEYGSPGPKPVPPPGCLPGPGEVLPLESSFALRQLIQSAICEKLSKESLDSLAYLVRRAHGLGILAKSMATEQVPSPDQKEPTFEKEEEPSQEPDDHPIGGCEQHS